jgi:outer membrane lipoprotein-sorting protein
MHLIVVMFCTLLSACQSMRVTPSLRGSDVPATRQAEVISRIADKARDFQSLKAIARVKVKAGDDKARFRYTMLYKQPNQVRLDSVPDGSAFTVGILLSNDPNHVYLDAVEKKATFAKSADQLMAKMLKINVSPGDLVSLILGKLPSSISEEALSSDLFVMSEDNSTKRVLLHSDKRMQYFEFDAESLNLMHAEYFDTFQEQIAMVIDCQVISSSRKCSLEVPKYSVSFDFNFTLLSENAPVNTNVFDVEVPTDYERDSM